VSERRGWPVTAEVAPHHLLLTDDLTTDGDTLHKVNPPLRTAQDVAALRTALLDGTIDAVATDHAPHPADRKAAVWCHAPFGMIGLETALAVVAEVLGRGGEPDWPLVAELMSHRPARIGGIDTLAGRPLQAGEPATFAWSIHTPTGRSTRPRRKAALVTPPSPRCDSATAWSPPP
jgi:dihydroorotase